MSEWGISGLGAFLRCFISCSPVAPLRGFVDVIVDVDDNLNDTFELVLFARRGKG